MRLLKVPRSAQAAYISLAVDHNSGRLFAARSDGFVDIWDKKALVEVSNMEKPSKDDIDTVKELASVDVHKGDAITCLKVYNDGILISADVEGRVYQTSLKDDNTIAECKLLIQHSSRINDIALLGDAALFATMNKVLGYDLINGKELTPITLRSDIRSIEIDPFQNFLVSIAFNKTVTVNQVQFVKGDLVTKKVNNSNQTLKSINDVTGFSWSEIGDKFALPNFNFDPNASVIGIISRKNWKSEFSLVGHFAYTIAKFNPKTYFDSTTKRVFNIVATSGIDKSLVIWNTRFQRPLLAASDTSKTPIQDLIWSQDGLSLFIASDSLVVMSFQPDEFGEVAPENLENELKEKVVKPDPIAVPEEPALENKEKELKQSEESTEVTEKDDKSKSGQPISSTTTVSTLTATTVSNNEATSATKNITKEPTDLLMQPTVMKNGKKRIAPTLLSTVNGSKPVQTTTKPDSQNGISHLNTTMEFDKPSYSVPKDLKRREEFNTTDQVSKKKKEIDAVEFIGSVAINPSTSFSKLRISTPKIRSSFVLDSPNDETLSLDIRNGSGNEQKPTKITLFKNSTKQIFVDFIPKLVGLATGGEGYFWAISTLEGVIHVYSDSGRKIFPPIVIGTPLSFLESKGQYLLAVSSIGEVFAWNVVTKKAVFEPTSLYPLLSRSNPDLLTRAENLTLCGISGSGVPIVTVSNGNGFLYDSDMGSWSLISDSWWAFGSQYWDATDKRAIGGSVINLLEKKTNDEIVRKGRGKFLQKMAKTMLMKEGYENLEKTISLAHLENRILISKKLKEETEFKNYLMIYCKRISEMGLKARLQEIFQDLLGPQIPNPDWDSKVLSFDKHELLKELIFACANIRAVQRILIPFATALNILDHSSFSNINH